MKYQYTFNTQTKGIEMCIIIMKECGVNKPSQKTMETCFYNNPDGAGIALVRGGTSKVVEIHKGFMNFEEYYAFTEAAVKPADLAVYHFRIGTSGGNTPQNTHPFPISNAIPDLQTLFSKHRYAFIHNGIIGKGTKTLSDTQLFVKDVLFPIRHTLTSRAVQDTIAKLTTGSRTVTIDAEYGLVFKTGDWIQDKDTGLAFSNATYSSRYYLAYDTSYFDEYSDLDCPMCTSDCTVCISAHHGLYECEDCRCLFDSQGEVWAM